jgi:mannose-6-phosphate isomerase-like protein (cupin superfamily)
LEQIVSSMYLAQARQHQQLEWLGGGTMSILLDSDATDRQMMVARFAASEGAASPYHMHTREDEVFMMISGAARFWCGDEEMEVSEGGIIFLPRDVPHAYRVTSAAADLLIICTPAGNEGLYRYAGRDRASPRPDGFEITAERLADGARLAGSVIIGPPR